MNKVFVWREFTSEGGLCELKASGPYYDRDESLSDGEWATESDAVAAFEKYYKLHGRNSNIELVLLTVWKRGHYD
jgi:hypothetical protein